MKQPKRKRGAQKGTTLKYSKVIGQLSKMNKPTPLNVPGFSKQHSVSTNLLQALQQLGYLKRKENGYVWVPSKTSHMDIAEEARILMNEMTNKKSPTRQRPTGKRAYKGRKSSFKKKKAAKEPTAKRAYNKPSDKSIKVKLAKKFAEHGDYEYALHLLS